MVEPLILPLVAFGLLAPHDLGPGACHVRPLDEGQIAHIHHRPIQDHYPGFDCPDSPGNWQYAHSSNPMSLRSFGSKGTWY